MADEIDLPASNQGVPAPACAMVIFGASGDLTKRKLIPAIHNLATNHLLPQDFAVIGVARTEMTDEDFRNKIRDEMKEFATGELEDQVVEWLLPRLSYVAGEFNDPATFEKLRERLQEADEKWKTQGCYLFYLAVPPSQFCPVVQRLGERDLVTERDGKWRRVVIEKPFGHDLESARALNRDITKVLDEKQIYRIDHYLGKETVQNILAFRFANGIFEPIWNRRYVDHVQITVAETVGVEARGGYYEEAGALRDMVQNHMFQLLALTAMEPPTSFAPDAVRDERVKVLSGIKPLDHEDVLRSAVRGQYGEGEMDGKHVPGYRQEPNVKPDSHVETFVALELFVENWRWAGVPFYLRTGKRLPRRVTEIAIQFKSAPFVMFRETPVEQLKPNVLVIRIQPEEGISLRFEGKVPGPTMRLGTVKMDFRYADYFGSTPSTGYETLLYDVMTADSTLFHRTDMVEVGWSVVTPILDVWKALTPRNFPNYAAGTWGPREADELIKDGRKWRN
ncbi:MAG TPA: glucose-6-phosphate dehydrogenase [Thermoanaerobaculia bacterium]|nr:glucose-6-phosphate dehydrogenase [Thermoanaerobaculia bacterium]